MLKLPTDRRAVIITLLAFAAFSTADASVKLLSQTYSVWQVTLLLALIAIVMLGLQALANRNLKALLPKYPGLAIARAAMLAVNTLMIYFAFSTLPLAEVYVLVFLMPIFVALLAGMVGGEHISKRAWFGILLGFVGVIVVLRPGATTIEIGHIAAIAAALIFAASLVLLRRAKSDESDMGLLSTLFIAIAAAALFMVVPTGITAIKPADWILVIACGVCFYFGHVLLVRAVRLAASSLLAPLQYSQIIWGFLYGSLLFAAPIELHMLIGAAVIIGSGFLVLV